MSSRPALRFVATAGAVLAVDQASKAAVRHWLPLGASVPVIDGALDLTHVRNTGAAFGLFPGAMAWFMLSAVIVLAGIAFVWWRHAPRDPWTVVALGLIAGGAAGNLIDRAFLGGVTDFFDVRVWPVFNVADVGLDIGVAIVVIRLLFGGEREGGGPHAEPGEAAGSEPREASDG
ncbi:MAG: signal peptidase II [Anaerosomatales bacterium]|uniref:signal peptidase II n=1 Tax=Parvivirga hydrogeniphila TaxID=2939460 RepID=UPI002260A974|nr:signal peptidase II [Parvivirga hydrogeniphila]MCL4079084.1 signal peptidase II [Parvivirga hydrogeniphila]MDI6693391.1 signal peptidase II [Anaerosomatales bacterium]